jgi:hypothetical protein
MHTLPALYFYNPRAFFLKFTLFQIRFKFYYPQEKTEPSPLEEAKVVQSITLGNNFPWFGVFCELLCLILQ